jgi:transcriptional regulator with XRE-family HTH domain
MTQKQLAQRLKVSASTVGMYEHDRRSPDNEMLIKIGKVFSVSTDSLLGVTELSNEAVDIISEMGQRIRYGNEILLNGVPMSKEDREKLLNAIEVATKVMLAEKEKRDKGL